MISSRQIMLLCIVPLSMLSFLRCASQKKLQDKAPVVLQQVYCQSWIAGVQGGGSGLNIFIPVDSKSPLNVKLDSVYFRGKEAKLESSQDNAMLFVGRFKSEVNTKKDVIMNGDGNAEFGNELPSLPDTIPFTLSANECVVSYKEKNKTKYFKINNVVEKPQQAFPSAPPLKKQ